MIDGQNFFDQTVKIIMRTYDNLQKITASQEGDYSTGCLLDYPYFKEHYKMIAIDLSKQQAFNLHLKGNQQINCTQNLDQAGNTTMFVIIEKAKETILELSQRTVEVL